MTSIGVVRNRLLTHRRAVLSTPRNLVLVDFLSSVGHRLTTSTESHFRPIASLQVEEATIFDYVNNLVVKLGLKTPYDIALV